MCIEEGCKTAPNYNYEGETKRLYCALHKLNNMVNVVSKPCIYEGCKKQPAFNYEDQTKGLYCTMHKLDNMINVKDKTCIEKGCKKIPSYNYEDKTKPLYCANHKLDNMVNIKSKTCVEDGCKRLPIFNYKDENKPLYCSIHKHYNMVNIVSKTCISDGCKKIPSYNYEGEPSRLYCSIHKLDNMVNIVSKMCISDGCKKIPNYNYEGQSKALYCATHKKENMIDIKHKTCKNDWCYNRNYNPIYEGYCAYCFMHTFPDKPVSKNYKTKERTIVEFIKSNFSEYTWISDKQIQNGCSKRRPDILCDLGYQVLIIEVDENQHIDYDCSCENKRIMEISQDINHRPLVFIRFNPDCYKKINGEKVKLITSCWTISNSGLSIIKKAKKNEWEMRLNTLKNQISYWLNPENQTNKTVEIVQLFYDE